MEENKEAEIKLEAAKEEVKEQATNFTTEYVEHLKKEVEMLREQAKLALQEKAKEEAYEISQTNTVYQQIEVVPEEITTLEQAKEVFNTRLQILREARGTPYEKFYYGDKPTDMWAAAYLTSRGIVNSYEEFMQKRAEAAARVEAVETFQLNSI